MKVSCRVVVRLCALAALVAAVVPSTAPLAAQDAKKSSPEAVQAYLDAAAYQNNKAYDLAVED